MSPSHRTRPGGFSLCFGPALTLCDRGENGVRAFPVSTLPPQPGKIASLVSASLVSATDARISMPRSPGTRISTLLAPCVTLFWPLLASPPPSLGPHPPQLAWQCGIGLLFPSPVWHWTSIIKSTTTVALQVRTSYIFSYLFSHPRCRGFPNGPPYHSPAWPTAPSFSTPSSCHSATAAPRSSRDSELQ